MSGRFFGKWPTDRAGNPIMVTIAQSPYVFKDSHKMALSRAGKDLIKHEEADGTPEK